MKKIDVCHLTVLNPALHSRIFFKEARTLVAAGMNVAIVGIDAKTEPFKQDNVLILPTKPMKRIGFVRIFRIWLIFRLALNARARVYHLHTPELLFVGLFLKILTGARLVYDVHEDYALNIRHYNAYSSLIKLPLATLVRTIERLAVGFWIDEVIISEKVFEKQFKNGVYIPNAFQSALQTAPNVTENSTPILLFTGLIAKEWGVFKTIDLWQKLNAHLPVRLKIIGFTPDKTLIPQIRAQITESGCADRFELIGGDEYVPFERIETEIAKCTFGAALYDINDSIRERIPTKFYEYMAYQKPLIYTQNEFWEPLNRETKFGLPFDGAEAAFQRILSELRQNFPGCYPKPIDRSVYVWQGYGQVLVEFYRRLLA